MSTWTDFRDDFLRGGFSTVLGGNNPEATPGDATQIAKPEQIPPQDLTTRDNANPPENFLMRVTSEQILTATAAIIAVLAVIHFMRK